MENNNYQSMLDGAIRAKLTVQKFKATAVMLLGMSEIDMVTLVINGQNINVNKHIMKEYCQLEIGNNYTVPTGFEPNALIDFIMLCYFNQCLALKPTIEALRGVDGQTAAHIFDILDICWHFKATNVIKLVFDLLMQIGMV
jgi:hypothetical protein